jgi:transposase
MLHLSATCKYYLCRTPVDIRKGFDSLSGMVTNQMGLSVLSGAVFIFFNKNHNQVKLLLWEGDGFSIYYKRLEKGTYECPTATTDCADISISHEAFQFILQGVSLKHIQRRKRYTHSA